MVTARVIAEHKTNYTITADGLEYIATVRGSFFTAGVFPKVGDYVLCIAVADGQAVIEEILPRHTTIARKSVDGIGEQVIVTNVDVLIIVMGLDGDFNMSRLERYLLLAAQSDVRPVVVLNKVDVVSDVAGYLDQVRAVTGEVLVLCVSAKSGEGMIELAAQVQPGETAVLLGSSGAGKSTITNWLLRAEAQAVQAVRTDDSRGHHTTRTRQLFTLPNGGYLIDTPGMRELGTYSTEEDEAVVFAELDELAHQCRFSNCEHEKSQGCAIMAAISAGTITERQYRNYLKLQRERLFIESKSDEIVARNYTKARKSLQKQYKEIQSRNHQNKGF